jgi:hypothetical protein
VDFYEIEQAFCEELQKIGASNMHVLQARTGRRPISASNLLKKDSEGRLFKEAPKPSAPEQEKAASLGTGINLAPESPFNMQYTAGPLTGAEARLKRKKNEPPSREDVETHYVLDQRDNAAVIPGTGTQATIAATNPSL